MTQQGFAIATFDHRGQGASGRLTSHPQIGHVELFEDYAEDFQHFISEIRQRVPMLSGRKIQVIAQSMGVAVFLLWQKYCVFGEHEKVNRSFLLQIQNCVFSSPLLKLNLGNIPHRLLFGIMTLRILLGKKEAYATLPGDLNLLTYGSDLTNCASRLFWYRKILTEHPELQLGAPSNGWLLEALRFEKKAPGLLKCHFHLQHSNLTILLAERDRVISLPAAESLFGHISRCKIVHIPAAQHDLFIETDEVRKFILEIIFKTFESQT